MAGAHLDSVQAGPGINDNGTGSATLLEIARQISTLGIEPENKLRFAWWGAEEEGLVGSTDYVDSAQRSAGEGIALYLNFDMIGSPNFARLSTTGTVGVRHPGPDGLGRDRADLRALLRPRRSRQRADRVRRTLGLRAVHRRRASRPAACSPAPRRSRPTPNRPAYGGLAGEAFDPCYHQACDDIDNISPRGLGQMSDAVAHEVNHYAYTLKFIPRPETAAKAARRHAVHSKYLGELLRK